MKTGILIILTALIISQIYANINIKEDTSFVKVQKIKSFDMQEYSATDSTKTIMLRPKEGYIIKNVQYVSKYYAILVMEKSK